MRSKREPASSSSSSEETDDEPELTQITITPWHRRMYMQASTRIKEEPREDGLGHICAIPLPTAKAQRCAPLPNDTAWRHERQIMLDQRDRTRDMAAAPRRTLGMRLRCTNHQLCLVRRPMVLSCKGYWATLVRLGHLFEVNSFRRSFAAALISFDEERRQLCSFLREPLAAHHIS